ncbi:MAG: FAD:protein FMN transferase [Gemmatimonadota bacterium]
MSTTVAAAVRSATAAMGTRFELVVASDDERAVRPLLEEAVSEIEALHARLTRFARDSLLSHINRVAAGSPVRLDRATFEMLRDAVAVTIRSGGAFDITLGTGAIVLDPDTFTIAFDRPGVTLVLGGIAKGFALDRAAGILRAGGITSALLHGGTSTVLAIGSPPDAQAWRVGLARGHQLPWVDLCDAALSVSRPFSQQLPDGETHIRDARDGAAIPENRFAVVIGPTACLADAWSTALAVLGERPAALGAEWQTFIEVEHE